MQKAYLCIIYNVYSVYLYITYSVYTFNTSYTVSHKRRDNCNSFFCSLMFVYNAATFTRMNYGHLNAGHSVYFILPKSFKIMLTIFVEMHGALRVTYALFLFDF